MSTQDVDIQFQDGEDEIQGKKKDRIVRQRATAAISIEIIEEILSRVPIRTLHRFMCVSKPWLSLMSEPSFTKLRKTRTSNLHLLISASDTVKLETYFIFASGINGNGSSITSILTIPDWGKQPYGGYTAQHVNGLLLFLPSHGVLLNLSCEYDEKYYLALAFVYNPLTHKIFKVPSSAPPVSNRSTEPVFYFLGFDEAAREHKILNIKTECGLFHDPYNPMGLAFEVFSLSDYSWRKVVVDFAFNPWKDRGFWEKGGVCVNSVIYFQIPDHKGMLAFDLTTETFSRINFPSALKSRHLSLMKIDNFLGVIISKKHILEIELWILEDYKNEVWVKQTITWPQYPLIDDPDNLPINTNGTGEVIFTSYRRLGDVLEIPIYDLKKKTFRSAQVNLCHENLCSETLSVDEVRSYTESIVPLKNSAALAAFLSGERID